MAEHVLGSLQRKIDGIKKRFRPAPLSYEKPKEIPPRVLYQRGGILALQFDTKDFNLYRRLYRDERVRAAFRGAGLDPDWAPVLFDRNQILYREPVLSEDQFAEEAPEHLREYLQTEHVVVVSVPIPDTERHITLYDVTYRPPAARHRDDHTVGVHTRDYEFILGLQGEAMLEILPTEIVDDNSTVSLETAERIKVKQNTLVILPPNEQGNRWNWISPERHFPFEAIYFCAPGPYDSKTIKQTPIAEFLTQASP